MFTKKRQVKVAARDNFKYVLRSKDGKVKKLWKANLLGQLLLRLLRRKLDPVGRFSKLAANGIRLPFVTGSYVSSLRVANTVVNVGEAGIASRINGAGSEAAFTFIAIGTGTTSVNNTDTALASEITSGGGARASATASRTTTNVTNDTATLVNTFDFTATMAVTEAGAFNASSAGTMLNRQTFSAINVVDGDSLEITVDVSVANSVDPV